MWDIKYFTGKNAYDKATAFMDRLEGTHIYTLIYVENGYAVEYKKLRVVG